MLFKIQDTNCHLKRHSPSGYVASYNVVKQDSEQGNSCWLCFGVNANVGVLLFIYWIQPKLLFKYKMSQAAIILNDAVSTASCVQQTLYAGLCLLYLLHCQISRWALFTLLIVCFDKAVCVCALVYNQFIFWWCDFQSNLCHVDITDALMMFLDIFLAFYSCHGDRTAHWCTGI